MSYIGSSAAPIPVAFSGVRTQSFNGTGSASMFTLNRQVNLVTDIEVIVNNVQQSPFDGSYSIVNNGLGLQFSENPSAGTNNIYVIYRDQPLGSLTDPGAVRKTGDTMTGGLTVNGNLLVAGAPGGNRVIGAASGTETTVVLQASTAIGGGPNIELTKDNVSYIDSNITKFRSTDASLSYGGFDTAGRWTMPNQPSFNLAWGGGAYYTVSSGAIIIFGLTGGSGAANTQTKTHNTGGHYSTSTGKFTAPVSGTYHFGLAAYHSTNSTDAYLTLAINGATALYTAGSQWGGGYNGLSISTTLKLEAGDTVHLLAGQNLSIYGMARFSGHLIG